MKPANWMNTIFDRDIAAAGGIEQLAPATGTRSVDRFGLTVLPPSVVNWKSA